ncbi:MAG: sulfur carrier protein ThiS [Alphaproteobacteria bacterium]|nr:sulfur carrier protein ThiS [Alphaproteobacteria bacterium]
MSVTINGHSRDLPHALSAAELLRHLALDPSKVALERNLEIVPRSAYGETQIAAGDRIEIVHFIGGGTSPARLQPVVEDVLEVAGRRLSSRLIVGTGKYRDFDQTRAAIEASGAEVVTVAVRRVNITDPKAPMLVDYLDPKRYLYLPNTAGCSTAEEAVRTLRLARAAGGWTLVKLEVLGDQRTLFPDMIETLRAAELLVREGFSVMVYCSDDPILAKRLEEIGCCAIMPLAAPIGSGLGIQNPINIRLIVEQSRVPVIVDAGVGTASDAAIAMELGCDGVLMNTAIAEAKDPIMMARAMRHAVTAGRLAYLAGRMPKKRYADPSSPLHGLI